MYELMIIGKSVEYVKFDSMSKVDDYIDENYNDDVIYWIRYGDNPFVEYSVF